MGLDSALEVAADWGKPSVLHQVGASYSVVDGETVLRDSAYLFVSTDAGLSYFLVRVDSAGAVGSLDVAGLANPDREPYDFAENELSEQDALDRAWRIYGESRVARCGPLNLIDVAGGIGEDGQFWSVGYRIGGTDHTLFLDAGTSEVLEQDDLTC